MTDIAFQKRDDALVIATQGRGFYVLDDMPFVRALDPAKFKHADAVALFRRRQQCASAARRMWRRKPNRGQNPPTGRFYYFLKEKPKDEVKLRILTASGKLVREISKQAAGSVQRAKNAEDERPKEGLAPAKEGMNRFVWDLRYEKATGFPGTSDVGWVIGWPAGNPRQVQSGIGAGWQDQVSGFRW